MFNSCDTDFNLERHLIPFLQDCSFFASISRQLHKSPTKDMPTAAVSYDIRSDQITLFWNPDFFASLSNWEIRGVLTHEFYHLVFGHLAARRKNPPKMWNVATDLAINSIIIKNAGRSHDATTEGGDSRPLPRFALVPGSWPVKPDGREMSKEEKDGAKLAALIASFPVMQASEWYFNKLQEFSQNEEGGGGQGEGGEDWINSIDDHGSWDDVPDEHREYIEGKIKSIIEKAVHEADATSTGWGSIPQEIREDIRRSVSNIINWRAVLRQFVGTLVRGKKTTSIKRINRRYPYIHPGSKRGWQAKLLIAMDQSGSIYDAMLEEFFAELGSLTKKVDITILPFDSHCGESDLYEWKKGQSLQAKRTRCGGTDFNAPSRLFNDPKNRGRWDGMLIMTDGYAPQPETVRAKRGWILGQGCKLDWTSSEIQIFLTKEKQMSGAWR